MKITDSKRSTVLVLGLIVGAVGAFIACDSGGSTDNLAGYDPNNPNGPGGGGGGEGGINGGGGEGGNGTGGEGGSGSMTDPAEVLYRGLEMDLINTCGGSGGGCHVTASAFATAPKFLAGPDSYKSIKAYPGIVVAQPFMSIILTKGGHEGPDLDTAAPALEQKLIAWLNQEALELQSIKLPTTVPVAVMTGPAPGTVNTIDLAPLENGITGAKLQFNAQLVGTSLELTNLSLVTAAGTAVHFQHPVFYQVPATKANPADPDTQDPSDSFSNTDVTVPGGATSPVPPGTVIFTGFAAWTATDKLRIEAYKLEKGTLTEAATPAACKSPTLFQSMVAANFTGAGDSAPLTCTNCHGKNGSGQGALDLSALQGTPDYAAACAAVLNKVNKTTPSASLIIAKPATAGTAHVGGKVTNTTQWTTDFTNFIQGGTIF
jgi:hypothetical protein